MLRHFVVWRVVSCLSCRRTNMMVRIQTDVSHQCVIKLVLNTERESLLNLFLGMLGHFTILYRYCHNMGTLLAWQGYSCSVLQCKGFHYKVSGHNLRYVKEDKEIYGCSLENIRCIFPKIYFSAANLKNRFRNFFEHLLFTYCIHDCVLTHAV
jgi:hypothetical protein